MKKQLLLLVLFLAAGLLAAAPVVTNVMAAQSGNLVVISYNLAHPDNLPCEVSLQVSNDGGSSYTIFPSSLSGDFGTVAATANGAQYQIFWYYGLDGVGNGNNYRVKVLADDGAGEVAQPVFDPPGGTYDSWVAVNISCATDGATIRYTVDSSEPTEASSEYTSPVVLYSTTTLKAKGFKPGWTPSAIASATYTIAFTPGQMIYVPGGTFTMGDTHGVGSPNELPVHSVTLNPFYIGKYEVTQAEYTAIMGYNPASGYGVGDNYPVYYVSWYSILKYCNLRSVAEELTPVYTISGSTNPTDWGPVPIAWNDAWNAAICNWNANGYRLPTEAEWEYAARGATNTPDYLYSGSDEINDVAWYGGNNDPYGSKPVGTKAPNGIGTFDMSGNVFEWCWDWYASYSSASQTNPTGPESGSYRVKRGGSWGNDAINCRGAYRNLYNTYYNHHSHGCRLCRTVL